MIIRITAKVLADPRWHPLLDMIVSLLEQPHTRHSFDSLQYKELVASAWLADARGARASIPEFIRKTIKAKSRDVPSDAITITIDDLASTSAETTGGAQIRAHPFGALSILMQPVHVLVEDESSDGAFILWVARLLGRDTIHTSYTAGRLLFRHAGGKGQLVKSARALTFGVWPREGRPILSLRLRAAAILDSDARHPSDSPNASIAQDVAQHVAFVHTLERRSIENYVPKKYFRLRLVSDGLADAADAYFRMTEEQQSHFPLKRGFFDRAARPQPQSHCAFLTDESRDLAERDHFRSANAADWKLFASGFGERLVSVFSDNAYRCEPNKPGQLTPASQTELNILLTKLIRHL